MSEFLEFQEWEGFSKIHVTRKFSVISKCSKECLGKVMWYQSWRHYCFFPLGCSVYSDRCLVEISEFVKRLNEEHRKIKVKR